MLCLFQHPLDSTHFPHRLLFLFCLDPFSRALLHKLLMCNRFHLVCLSGCSQILLQRMCLFLQFSYPYHLGLWQLIGTISPFYLRMMFSMFPAVWGVSSVTHNWAVFQFLVLKLSFPYEWAIVWQVPLSGRVLYIFVQKFWIWSFVQLVQLSFGKSAVFTILLCFCWNGSFKWYWAL